MWVAGEAIGSSDVIVAAVNKVLGVGGGTGFDGPQDNGAISLKVSDQVAHYDTNKPGSRFTGTDELAPPVSINMIVDAQQWEGINDEVSQDRFGTIIFELRGQGIHD